MNTNIKLSIIYCRARNKRGLLNIYNLKQEAQCSPARLFFRIENQHQNKNKSTDIKLTSDLINFNIAEAMVEILCESSVKYYAAGGGLGAKPTELNTNILTLI